MFKECSSSCYKQATLGSVIVPARLVTRPDLPHRDFPERGSRDVGHLRAWNRQHCSHVVLNLVAQSDFHHMRKTTPNLLISFIVLRYA